MTAQAGTVYVLHIEPPLHHARHYVGWTCDATPTRRVAEHMAGTGSPLIRAAVAAGRTVDLVLAMPGDRGLERRMHNRHGTRVCPRCRPRRHKGSGRQLPMFRKPAPSGGRPSLPRRLANAA